MAFLTNILFKIAYYGVTLAFPAYQVYMSNRQNKIERLWVLYFFILGIFTILENTLLFPVKYVFSLVSCCSWLVVKLFFCLWLQHPSYRGALFLEQRGEKYLNMAHQVVSPLTDKVMSLMGAPKRE